MGPVTKTSPEANCFKTTTLLPLWAPARTMAMVPGCKVDLNDRLCFEKKFLEVPLAAASMVGTSFLNLLTRTIRFPPFLSPLTGFSTKVGFLAAAFLGVVFFKNL